MLFEDMNWMQVEEYLRHDDRIIVVTGACEQHGYLSLLADVKEPAVIAERAAERERVLVAPPLPFGVSPYFAAYPGTISLSVQTFMAVLREVIDGLHGQGFRRILVLNGHGGNRIGETLVERANAHPGLVLDAVNWWQLPEIQAAASRHGLVPDHANWLENFPFTRIVEVPKEPKTRISVPAGADALTVRRLLGDGSYGGPYQAPDAVMEEILETAVGVIVDRLRAM